MANIRQEASDALRSSSCRCSLGAKIVFEVVSLTRQHRRLQRFEPLELGVSQLESFDQPSNAKGNSGGVACLVGGLQIMTTHYLHHLY